MNHAFTRPDRRVGLTAIELVTALALFVIIFGALLVALNSATDVWTLSADKNRNLLKARTALDRIATDLACAVAPQTQKVRNGASATVGAATQPLFVAKGDSERISLFFIRALSPMELTDAQQVSLEFVAYQWTTNGLSRYTRPVFAEATRTTAPDLAEQLRIFQDDYSETFTPSNLLASAIVDFEPRLYQPLSQAGATVTAEPKVIDLGTGEVKLSDLPDFVDIHIAFVNPNDGAANGSYRTNYLTRRITLPAAQASRLP